ncbi:MAG TPA: 23S rRNA methyltransferase [Streptosporangiaceae bacterium]
MAGGLVRGGENERVLDDVIGWLVCPYCGGGLRREGGSLRCGNGHTFDIARQGYVSLLRAGGGPARADTAAMVAARAGFLAAGHFGSLAEEVAAVLADELTAGPGRVPESRSAAEPGSVAGPGNVPQAGSAAGPGCVVDAGAGTGYYLAGVLGRLPGRFGLALDASKFALRRAAHVHPRVGAVACDVWQRLPVADHAAVAALSVFAPRNGPELHRILHPHGRLLVVTPLPAHLGELIEPLGMLTVGPDKDERLAGKLGAYFGIVSRREHVAALQLRHEALRFLVAMGPSAWHVDPAETAARIGLLPDPMRVTLAVTISVYRVRGPADEPPGP